MKPEVEAVAKALAAIDCVAEAAWPEYVNAANEVITAYKKARAITQYDKHDL